MHWLNMSAHIAGTEEIIQHIKQHCRNKNIFIVLYLRKSLNAHKKNMPPHSVSEIAENAEALKT